MISKNCGKDSYSPSVLVDCWFQWKGAIDCGYTERIWPAVELRKLSRRAAETFYRAGFREGDLVAVLLSNTVAFPTILISLLDLGCNPVLMYAA